MKSCLLRSFVITLLCTTIFLDHLDAQEDMNEWEELYLKKNTAVTDLSRLGVNIKQYAKCVRSVNMLEVEKTVKNIVIGKNEFVDDGRGYDLIADDGILTSKMLFNYSEGEMPLQLGQYQSNKDNYLLHDELFEHTGRFPFPKIQVKCKIRWVSCNEYPPPYNQICNSFGWPYGEYKLYDCEIGFSF